jgi:hypothetical protein
MSQERAGVRLVAEGVAAYIADLTKGAKAEEQLGGAAAASAAPVAHLGKVAIDSGSQFSAFGEIATGALREVGAVAVSALGQAVASRWQLCSILSIGKRAETLKLGLTSFKPRRAKGSIQPVWRISVRCLLTLAASYPFRPQR